MQGVRSVTIVARCIILLKPVGCVKCTSSATWDWRACSYFVLLSVHLSHVREVEVAYVDLRLKCCLCLSDFNQTWNV
jgi:hypothetical protein